MDEPNANAMVGLGPLVDRLAEGRRLDAAGDYDAAESALAAVIEEADDRPGTEAIRAAAATTLAGLRRYEGRLDDAAAAIGDALALASRLADPVLLADAAAEAALLDLELGDVDGAARHAEQAIAATGAIPDQQTRDGSLALALQARANVARQTGRFGDARRDLQEALHRAKLTYGPESLEVAGILSDIGVLHKFSGAFQKSVIAHRRALGIVERVGGRDHPDIATIEHNLGGLEHARGQYAAAATHARRSVEGHARTLGDDHVVTVLDRVALAAILDRSGGSAEARDILVAAIPLLEATLGPDHREVAVAANNLAAIAHRDGDLELAERWYLRALAIKERSIGSDAPSLANTLVNLAALRRAQGRADEAVPLLSRAVAILEASVEPTHPTLAVARRQLVRAERESRDVSEGDVGLSSG